MKRVEHVNLEKELIANMIAVERHALYETDMGDKGSLPVVHISAVTYSKCMIN